MKHHESNTGPVIPGGRRFPTVDTGRAASGGASVPGRTSSSARASVTGKMTFRVPRPGDRGALREVRYAEAVPGFPAPEPVPADLKSRADQQVLADQQVPTDHRLPALAGVGAAEGSGYGASGGSTFVLPAPEDDELTGMVEVVGITDVTHDVKTFELRAPWLTSVDFEPGQYVTMRVPELGLERCYSISSAPFGTNTFTVTVKRVAGGAVSMYLHDTLEVGGQVHVDGPYGLFSTSFHPAAKHLFVSGGSGITPIMAMVRSLLARPIPPAADIVLVHNAATPDDIVFRPELEQLAQVPGVSVVIMCSRDSAAEVWAGRRGRISAEALAAEVPDLSDREVFVCGPSGYMDAVRLLLEDAGVPGGHVHEESFVFGAKTGGRRARAEVETSGAASPAGHGAGPRVGACNPLARFGIEFRGAGTGGAAVRVDCDASTTVLEAANAAGLSMPSSCEEGACGTCKSLLVSGEVDMNHAGGIRPREIAAGKFLPCCSTPKSDLIVG